MTEHVRRLISIPATALEAIDGTERVMLLGEIANNLSVRLDRAEAQGLWLTPMGHAEEVLLRRRFAKGELASPFRGMYARCSTFETASIRERTIRTIRTLGLLHPSWVFCGYSAAVIHGLQVPNTVLGSVHYCANGTSHRGSPLIRHHLRLAPQDIVSNTGCASPRCGKRLSTVFALPTFAWGWQSPTLQSIGNWRASAKSSAGSKRTVRGGEAFGRLAKPSHGRTGEVRMAGNRLHARR